MFYSALHVGFLTLYRAEMEAEAVFEQKGIF